MKLAAAIQSMRIPFLVLTPASVFLGVSTVAANHVEIQWHLLIPALIGGLLAHVGVNTLNEYLDFRSGLDLVTVRTPFSGGSGALPRHPEAARLVLATGIASLALTLLIGFYFVLIHGAGIIPIGLLGFVLVITYTPWVNRYPLLCLVAPGTGFGFLMVVGTQYVMEGAYRPLAWLAGLVPFFLVNNLLLLNQYPDIQADAGAGRRHFPIAYGPQWSNIAYGVSLLLAALVVLLGVATGWFPTASLASLVPMAPAVYALRGALLHGSDIGRYPVYMAANVLTAILTPVVLGLSFLLG